MTTTTDVIIPARGESFDTLAPIVTVFKAIPTAGRVIVVARDLDPNLWLWLHRHADVVVPAPKDGKGEAVRLGLQHVQSYRVAFCDADLTGFTAMHAEILTEDYGSDAMIIGVTDYVPEIVPWHVDPSTWCMVSGERSLPLETVAGLDLHGYCMEVQINVAARKQCLMIQPIAMPGCKGAARWDDRRATEAMRDYYWLKERNLIA